MPSIVACANSELPAADVDARAVRQEQRLDVVFALGAVPVVADRLPGALGAGRLPADPGEQLPSNRVAVVLEAVAAVERGHEPDVVEERRDVEDLRVERAAFAETEQGAEAVGAEAVVRERLALTFGGERVGRTCGLRVGHPQLLEVVRVDAAVEPQQHLPELLARAHGSFLSERMWPAYAGW